jgi:uncharacterized protein
MPAARREEIFAIPRGEGDFYLYAPLRRCVAVVNGAAVRAVVDHLEGKPAASAAAEAAVTTLRSRGLFGEEPPAPPLFPAVEGFRPHEVTLFLTSRCNLRCRYCYAEAGRKAVEMPWEVARAAIELVADNAGFLGQRAFAVGFHGGGEPTLAWDLLVRCVDHAKSAADARGLDVELFAATNGLLSAEQRALIGERFTTVTVSLDGPPDIQDQNRPTAGGGPSSAAVQETLADFDAMGVHYGVRVTVTAASVGRMAEIVDWITTRCHARTVHLEPVWACGRCLVSGESPPADDAFAEGMLAAETLGRERGVDVTYSGARLDVLTSKFCAAPGDGFNVLPEGAVTACYEVTELDDPRARTFHYGRFDPAAGRFELDEERLAALRRLSVEHLPFCADCFCRWHCAGDCLAKALTTGANPEHRGSTRCRLNQRLTLEQLEGLVRAGAAAEEA